MKINKNGISSLILAAAILMTALLPMGCSSKEAKIKAQLNDLAETFIADFASGDKDKMEDLVEGRFDYQISYAKQSKILLKIASKTEIDEIVSFEVDQKEGKARLRTKLSYIDIYEFGKDKENRNISVEECMANVDTYKNRSTTNYTFNFVLDDDGNWKIRNVAAERYEELFNHQYVLSVIALSKEQAKQECKSVFEKLARGEFNQLMFTYDINEMGAFNTWGRSEKSINDAMSEFAKAYFSFIVEHGITVEETDNPLQYKITGYVPSKDALLSYFASDEYAIESSMATIRAELAKNDTKRQEVWDNYIAGTYYDLAKQIPNLLGEEFSVIFKVKAGDDNVVIAADGPLFTITTDDIFACPKYEYAQGQAARKKAIQALFDAGELTRAQYDMYMSEYRNDGGNYPGRDTGNENASTGTTSWKGSSEFPNQAVNVKEETPEWSEGKIIYGTSDPDKNGISMLYSKQPGWLNTAGYNLSETGITVMVKYDKKFAKGTELEFDWDINGSTQQYAVPFVVPEDGADEFFFTIPAKLVSAGDTAEFRLWEKGHAHVIAYVKLTKT
jgi:hypothetical protein